MARPSATDPSGRGRSSGADVDLMDRWTPETAWVWGLWFGDGWSSSRSNGRVHQVCLSGSLEVMEKARAAIGSECVVSRYVRSHIHQIGSQSLVDLIERKFEIPPGKKSHTMPWPEVPPEVLPQFVRGLWDSDGSWWVHRVKKPSRTYEYLYGGYASCSVGFLEGLRLALHEVVGVTMRPVEPQTNGNIVRYTSKDTPMLGEWMYADGRSDLRCGRKFDIFSGALSPRKD